MSGSGCVPTFPLVAQVSRFDPCKDSLGVIDVYRLARPHSQLVAVARTPARLRQHWRRARQQAAATGRPLHQAMVQAERQAKARIVADAADVVTFQPFAARTRYETWIVPLGAGGGDFAAADDATLRAVARALRALCAGLYGVLGDVAYSLVVRSGPPGEDSSQWWRWHLVLRQPRQGRHGGLRPCPWADLPAQSEEAVRLTRVRGARGAMDEARWERAGAASGFAVLAVSAGAVAFERGGPSPGPGASAQAIAEFFADHRGTLVTQSVLFVLGAGIQLWFLGSLRSFLVRAEGGTGRLATVAYGAGVAGTAVNLVAQAFQVGLATGTSDEVPPAVFATMTATFGLANIPLAVMLAAVAVLSLRTGAFPAWLAWLSAAAAVASLVLSLGIAVDSGPLAPGGGVNNALYSAFVIWLVPTTTVMVRRLGSATGSADPASVHVRATQ